MLLQVSAAKADTDIATGGGTIKLTGPDGKAGPTLIFTGQGSLTSMDNADSVLDTTSVDVFHVTMDSKTGNINIGSITLNFKETADGEVTSGGFEMAIRGGSEAATTSTKLRDIDCFTDGDGNNIFDNKQELTIYGNGTSTVVHLEGNDTIATLVEKMNKAIQGLGMGSDDPNVNKNLVQYVTVPGDSGWDTLKGTLLIQTGMTGEQGELSFVGNQALIDAFAMAEVQSATNNESTVTIRDAHTGSLVGTEVTGDDRVYTLIDGVELVIDSRAGVTSRWDAATNGIVFDANPALADKKMHIHIVDNRTSLQIGANKGQDLDVSIPQLDIKGLGIENITMVSQDRARNAIGKIDAALTRVVSARATIGAQVSRLEYTIQNLATARENLVAAESRIRDLDVAEESTAFASHQVLVQSGIAMLAQANQLPQMALQLIQG
jgi:flagellin